METETKVIQSQTPISFHLLPSGELKIEGAITESQKAEIAQQFFDAAILQRKLSESKLDELTKWNNIYQHFVILSVLILAVFVLSFVATRTIKNVTANKYSQNYLVTKLFQV